MRDVIFSLLILALVPVAYRRPLIGMLTFSWLAYMRPNDLCWGFAREQRWSFLIAAVTAVGYFSNAKGKWFVRDARCYVMIVLALWVGLSILMGSMKSPLQTNLYVEYCKIIGIALFTTVVVVRREHLRLMMWIIALSFGFYGVKVGLSGVLSGGHIKVLQGPGGMLEDNNNFGLALTMGLPLLVQLAKSERSKVLRRGVMAMIPLTALTIFLTHSRGAFLALGAMAVALVWRSKNRLLGFGILAASLVGALSFVDRSYLDRLNTIQDYEQDGSAMGRLAAWATALNMAKAEPAFGVGYGMFQQNYWNYASGSSHEGKRVAHNAYLQVLAECGTPAFLMYTSLIVFSMLSIWKVRKRAKQLYYSSWILDYAAMMESSMIAFIVGSVFLNRAQFDLFYHFVALVLCFERIAIAEMEGRGEESGERSRGGELRVVRPRGFGNVVRRVGFGRAVPGGLA
jgi:probable O-glycosylation ligase (exosortase A-associated)